MSTEILTLSLVITDCGGTSKICCLVDTFYQVKGYKLPWDDYKTQRFDDEAIEAIKEVAEKYDIPVELITKLIVSVDKNKLLTKSTKLQKAFDQIINQGWLHYDAVERVFDNED